LTRNAEIHVHCPSGQRAFILPSGFDAKVLSGGMLSHAMLTPK
jgi:hypothetical protein